MAQTITAPRLDLEVILEEKRARVRRMYYADPLGFVLNCYPWGQPGELQSETGPDDLQRQFLIDLGEEVKARKFNGSDPVMPILMTTASGHGTGKSVLGAWITNWILSTRPYSIGTVTANTFTQLESRTWAQIQRWTKLCVTEPWFEISQTSIKHKKHPETWKVLAQTCREENAQSFAGQHAKNSTSWYYFDEGSDIGEKIWEVAAGGITDGEPMFFAWGQPTRNTGKFYRINFGSEQHRWNHRRIDSRQSKFTNKALIAQWQQDYGEDSDYFRVRVLGLPPTASEFQFIDWDRIRAAQDKEPPSGHEEPLIVGVDVPDGGAAWFVARFRRGYDGRTIPPIRIPGEQCRERGHLIAKLAEILKDPRPAYRVSAMFIDSAFGAPLVEGLKRLGFENVTEVRNGAPSPDKRQANQRAYSWNKMKDWLQNGSLDSRDEKLASDLAKPGYHLNRTDQLTLESKADMRKRGESSPDDGDALALTFAQPVAMPVVSSYTPPRQPRTQYGWMNAIPWLFVAAVIHRAI